MSATNNSFVLVTIITVLNVMQEVIDPLIFVYMSFTPSSSVISKLWKGMNCTCSWYPGLEAIIICSLCVLIVTTDEESSLSFLSLGSIFWGKLHSSGPTSLQCIPLLNMSMSHSQYLLFRNSGIVNTGFSEFPLYIYMVVRHTG